MEYKYGNFTTGQMIEARDKLRNKVFWLLVVMDPNSEDDFSHIDVEAAFKDAQNRINGFGNLLGNPSEIISAMSLVEAALVEYKKPTFDFPKYRKLILDACSEINKIGEV